MQGAGHRIERLSHRLERTIRIHEVARIGPQRNRPDAGDAIDRRVRISLEQRRRLARADCPRGVHREIVDRNAAAPKRRRVEGDQLLRHAVLHFGRGLRGGAIDRGFRIAGRERAPCRSKKLIAPRRLRVPIGVEVAIADRVGAVAFRPGDDVGDVGG